MMGMLPGKILFFKSHLGLFGMDLGFIVGLSFVRKLMPLCPLAHKSPDFFFSPAVLHFEPQGSTIPNSKINKKD